MAVQCCCVLQSLSESLGEGRDILHTLLEQGTTVKQRSSKFGGDKVDHELHATQSDFDDWKTQLEEAASTLDKCMTLSDAFDDLYESLSQWIGKRDVALKMELGLLATAEEKTAKLQQTTALRQEVLAKQADLDKVNMQAQQLVQVHADLRVPHRVAQLSTRYQAHVTLTGVRIYCTCYCF